MNRSFFAAAALAALMPFAAKAQDNFASAKPLLPPLKKSDALKIDDLSQSAGYIQLNGEWIKTLSTNGRLVDMPLETEAVVKCGFSIDENETIVADPSGNDFIAQNRLRGEFGRYRRVGKNIIISTLNRPDSAGQGLAGLLIANILNNNYKYLVVRPDNSTISKNCEVDSHGNIKKCQKASALITATEAKADMKEIDDRCSEILNPTIPQIDKRNYSREKVDGYKQQQVDNLKPVLKKDWFFKKFIWLFVKHNNG